ncbi:MAG: DUF1697 domain-containing protein [Gemmataceae bacterium]
MATNIALVRGVNVGGKSSLPMDDLRALVVDAGLADARTLLASGNVVFDGGRRGSRTIERRLEAVAARRYSRPMTFFVRTAKEWAAVVANNPFPKEAEADPSHLVVIFLKEPPAAASVVGLQKAIRGRERVCCVGRELYAVYPDGIGTSKLTNTVIDKALGTTGTARNWNTVLKLAAMT